MHKHLSSSLKLLTLSSLLVVSIAYAWTAPTALPPAGNTPPPLNTSITGQIKSGGLVIDSLGIVNTALSALNVSGGGLFGGSVGIGTTPSDVLDVRMPSNVNGVGVTISAPNSGAAGSQPGLQFKRYNAGTLTTVSSIYGEADGGSSLRFATAPALSPTAPIANMVINGAGNVGIGTLAPQGTLSIGSSIYRLDKSDASPNAGYVRFGDNTGWKFHIGRSQESAAGAYNTGTTGVLMTVQDNGKVGIGTTAPVGSLQVAGTAFNPFGLPNGNIAVGNIVHPQWAATGVALGNQGAGTNTGVIGYNADTFWISELNSGATAIPLVSISPTGTLTANTDVCTAGGKCLSGAATLAGGVANTIPKWTGASALGNSSITDGGVGVTVNTTGTGLSYTTPLTLSNSYLGAGSSSFILFDGATGPAIRGDALWANNVGNLFISPNAANKSLKLRGGWWNSAGGIDIDTNGNVGIGTTAPGGKLEIVNPGIGPGLIVNKDGGQIQLTGGVLPGGLWTSAGRLYLGNWNTAAGIVTDLGSGNVGIGTTAPFSKTTIAKPGVSALTTSDATNNAHLTLAGSDSLVRLQFGTMNVAPYSGLIQASYDNGGAANGLEALSLNPNGGNVGIGTTAPGAKLEVAGDARINGIRVGTGGAANGANTAVGVNTLNANMGTYNNAIGFQALLSNTTGYYNTAEGAQALLNNTTGYYNTATGLNALLSNNTGIQNTAVGGSALNSNTGSSYNTAVGAFAGGWTTGGSNTGVGNAALITNTTGSSNTALGAGADVATGALTNATAIGANAKVAASNSLVLGGTGANAVNVGIGTTTPAYMLDVYGTVSGVGFGNGTSNDGNGVYGVGITPGATGVRGISGPTVAGISTSAMGVYGSSAQGTGVYGSGGITGVYGYGPRGVAGFGSGWWGSMGVFGWNVAPSAAAVAGGDLHFGLYGMTTAGAGGVGVYGSANTDFMGSSGEKTVGGVWTNASDRNKKENFKNLDNQFILNKILELPITEWNYKTDKRVKHIGPVAQDFYSLFRLGSDDISISTIDPSGIALVGVKALNEKIETLKAENEKLKKQNDDIIRRLEALEAKVR